MDFCFLDSTTTPLREQVGNKGYFLHQMTEQGLPVPPAALLTTELWQAYQKNAKATVKKLREEIIPQIVSYLKEGNGGVMPLVSIRSSGAVSMPGMMDTILNVGTNETSLAALSKSEKNAQAFQADTYARFLSMYGHTVLGLPKSEFDAHQVFASIEEVEAHFKGIYENHGKTLPGKEPEEQILQCVLAVFDSWDNERAKLYRKLNKIPNDAGTAVVIQRMVFGNRNDNSATGVLFSRNPNNGEPKMMGEYLVRAQGEDVVSGSHTPEPIATMYEEFPEIYEQLETVARKLEQRYKQVQDIEFTVEDGTLFILQARSAKCSPFAKLRMLMDLKRNEEVSANDVLNGLTLAEYLDLNVRQVDPSFREAPDGQGLAASMGALVGRVVFGPSTKYEGQPTIFVAKETTPDDLQSIHLSTGILTASGGATSHAAVVARGMGKVCIVGCSGLKVEVKDGIEQATLNGHVLQSGDWITMDAHQGRVWVGKDVPIIDAKNTQIFWDLEDLVFEANPTWARLTSKVDEIIQDNKTLFLTYALDEADDDKLRDELHDALQYLTNGVMDLTGKLDFLQKQYPNQFLFADKKAEQVFLRKKQALLNISETLPYDFKIQCKLHLGPYAEHAGAFLSAGFPLCEPGDVSFDPNKDRDADMVVVQGDERVDDTKMAISSRNALLRALK